MDRTRTRQLLFLIDKYCFKGNKVCLNRNKEIKSLTIDLTRVAVLCFFATYLTVIFAIALKKERKEIEMMIEKKLQERIYSRGFLFKGSHKIIFNRRFHQLKK